MSSYHDIPPPDLTPDQARWIVLAQRASAGSRAAAKEMAALLPRLMTPAGSVYNTTKKASTR